MLRIAARIEASGVAIRFIKGWEERGGTFSYVPRGLVDHHDASTRKSGEWGALGVITYGRTGIPGPLSQFQVARCLDGVPKVAIVAAGRANHAGRGGPHEFQGGYVVPADQGNAFLYGMEKANDGLLEPYTYAAHYATDVVASAVLAECRGEHVDRCIGHSEWARPLGRKSDPTYSMDWRRRRIAALDPTEEDIEVADRVLVKDPDTSDQYLVVLGTSRKLVPSWSDYLVYKDVLKIPTTVLTAAELQSLPDITVRSTT